MTMDFSFGLQRRSQSVERSVLVITYGQRQFGQFTPSSVKPIEIGAKGGRDRPTKNQVDT
jgi:hypothetical protein